MELAVDHVDGYSRAGFLVTNDVGESVFVLQATGPDEGTAIRRPARLVREPGHAPRHPSRLFEDGSLTPSQ